jgi:hypothetical protein
MIVDPHSRPAESCAERNNPGVVARCSRSCGPGRLLAWSDEQQLAAFGLFDEVGGADDAFDVVA